PWLERNASRCARVHHAALHLPAVLRARDDLLPRIAAFAEVDAAERLEVDHLRHELVLRRARDQRPAGADLLQRPLHFVGSRRLVDLCRRTELEKTPLANAHGGDVPAPYHVARLVVGVPDAELSPGIAFVRD